jgi:hypothetical protein
MSDVIVLHAALPGHFGAALDAQLMPRLPYAKRLQLARCDAGARRASLAAIELLLLGAVRLGSRPLDPAQLRFPAGGKPFVEGGPRFSISHSATRVAVALSASCELGLDVEDFLDGGEAAEATPDKLERWAATEAALKAVGDGLRSVGRVVLAPDLATARVGAVTVQLRTLPLGAGIVARLATIGPVGQVGVEEISRAQPGPRPATP